MVPMQDLEIVETFQHQRGSAVTAGGAARLYQLSDQHALGTATYDNILDIRGVARELRALHSP